MSKTTHNFLLGLPNESELCPNSVYFVKSSIGVDMYVTSSANELFQINKGSLNPSDIESILNSPNNTISIEHLSGLINLDVQKYINTDLATLTIGGFLEGEPITPPEGLSSQEMWNKLFSNIENTTALWEIVQENPYNLKVPTQQEWQDEINTWATQNANGGFNSVLKLPYSGLRNYSNGSLDFVDEMGFYHTSNFINSEGAHAGLLLNGGYLIEFLGFYAYSLRLIIEGTFTQQQFDDNYQNLIVQINGLDYGFVYNPTTQRIWLDRNLGATQVATSLTDSDAYGDLFQWGRPADGHEKRNSSTANIQATTPQPEHGDFIIGFDNWLTPNNDNLWQGTSGINNPAGNPDNKKLIGKNGKKASYKDLLDGPVLITSIDADLLDGTILPDIFKGIIVYSEESETHYKWNGLDRTNVNNWEPLGGLGGLSNVKEKIITVSTSDLGVTDLDDPTIPQKIIDYAIANDITREPDTLHRWGIIGESLLKSKIYIIDNKEFTDYSELVADDIFLLVDNRRFSGDYNDLDNLPNIDEIQGTQNIVDSVEDLKQVEAQEGDVFKTKAYGDSGYSLWKLAVLTLFETKGGERVEQFATFNDFTGEDNTKYYVARDTNNVYKWDGVNYNRILEAELGSDLVFIPSSFNGTTDLFPTTGDSSMFYRTTRNVSGAGSMYRWDDDTQSYISVNFDMTTVDPVTAFPRQGFEDVLYFDESTDNTYIWDAITEEYRFLSIALWQPGATQEVGDLCRYEYADTTLIYECLHPHTTALTLEPDKQNYGKVNLWKESQSTTTTPWSALENITKGNLRLFNGVTYEAVKDHFTRADLDPEVSIQKYKEILQKGEGSNYYVYRTTPVTSLVSGNTNIGQPNESLTGAERDDYEIAPLPYNVPTHIYYGTNFRAENGAIVGLRLGRQAVDSNKNSFIEKGTTNLNESGYVNAQVFTLTDLGVKTFALPTTKYGTLSSDSIQVGEKFYPLDDDVTIIRPEYESFDGNGYWQLVTPDKNHLTPADAGGHSTVSAEQEPFDSRDALQKIFHNIYYPVKISKGGWYVSDSVFLDIHKEYISEGNKIPKRYEGSGRDFNLYNYSSGVIWTNRNINVIVNGTEVLNTVQLNIDCQNIKAHTKAAFKIDSRARNRIDDLDLVIRGNKQSLGFRPNIGTKGILLDPEDAQRRPLREVQNGYKDSFGVCYGLFAKVNIEGCASAFWRKPDIPNINFFTNGLKVIVTHNDWNKQLFVVERSTGQAELVTNTYQTRPLLGKNEYAKKPTYLLQGKIYTEGFPMDFMVDKDSIKIFINGEEPQITRDIYDNVLPNDETDLRNNYLDSDGRYEEVVGSDTYTFVELHYPQYFVDFVSEDVTPGPFMARAITRRPDIFKRVENIQSSDSVLPHIQNIRQNIFNTDEGTVPEFLYNNLMFIDKRADEFYFKAFESKLLDTTDIDIENYTEKSEGNLIENTEITIDNPIGCFNFGEGKTRINFGDNVNPETDFVEIFIKGNAYDSNEYIKFLLSNVGVNDRYPKKIQVIVKQGNDVKSNITTDLENIKGLKSFKLGRFDTASVNDTLIIRFIGLEHIFAQEIIEDIVDQNLGEEIDNTFSGGSYSVVNISQLPRFFNNINFLHKGGDQVKEGNLEFTYPNSPVFRNSGGDKYKLQLDSNNRFRKVFRFAADWADVEALATPLLLESPTDINGSNLPFLNQVVEQFGRTVISALSSAPTLSKIIRLNNTDPDFPTDPFFSPSNSRGRGIYMGDNADGLLLFSSAQPNGNSIIARKRRSSGFSGGYFYLWDTEHLTKAQYDSFIRVASEGVWNVNTTSVNKTASFSECILVDAGSGNVEITLPTHNNNQKIAVIKTDNSANTVTVVATGGLNINGQASYALNSQYDSVVFISNSTDWNILSSNVNINNIKPTSTVNNTSTFELTTSGGTFANDVANGATDYTVTIGANALSGAYIKLRINAATEPTVNGVTTGKISGAPFQANTDMDMVIYTEDLSTINYYFLER